ncbi:MAG: polyribonucleotide nucleotidyltransferase [Patescibacteria group bacterium]
MKKVEKSIELGGRKLTLSSGVLAEQAAGSVLATYGETVVLATVATAKLTQDLGYFPLTVEYQERLYAGGRIKGSRWVKREGRPSDAEILSARLIDRSLRPLFPQNYDKEVQVIVTVLSVDIENDPSILSAIAASAAVAISPVSWKGPVGTLRVGKKNGTYFTNPLDSELPFSEMDLVVSATTDAILMIEAGAKEASEEAVLEGVAFAQKEAKKIVEVINELTKEVGAEKEPLPKELVSAPFKSRVKKLIADKIDNLITDMAKHEGGLSQLDEIKVAVSQEIAEEEPEVIFAAIEKIIKEKAREMTLKGKRVDGRAPAEIRPVSGQVGVLPRTHGSAIFQRGQTQVLTVTTLGAPSLEQLIESAEGEESKRYMHHYSMPPYAIGTTGRVGYPSRREIGHGALAERALEPVIPQEEKFPYTIRVVSEVMSSNGSTSMASVCGSTLSLMDSGVPIISPVSGIAMGMVLEDEKNYVILSDIMGMEDYLVGDMDFKVAGTEKGITALQLDVKTLNLTVPILEKALSQAKEGRSQILATIREVIKEPREKVSAYAPKIKVLRVAPEKIGEVIGPGGKTIRKIIADTGAQVEVEDDGAINITGTNDEAVAAAVARIEGLTKEVSPGEIYEGEVKRVQPFGAFVEILPGKEGLVHVSDMREEFVSDPNEIVKVGDRIQVRVREIDDLGRINLSMLLDPSKDKPKGERTRPRGERPRFHGRGFERRRTSGPHFPTSRFIESKRRDFGR